MGIGINCIHAAFTQVIRKGSSPDAIFPSGAGIHLSADLNAPFR